VIASATPMRWLPILLASTAVAQRPAKPLRFDLAAIPATRDSFAFFLDHVERGSALWQYETRGTGAHQQLVYTATSQFEPVEEQVRVVLDRATSRPESSFYHVDRVSETSDTDMVEYDLSVENGQVRGRHRYGLRNGKTSEVPVHATELPPGAVWSYYELYAAAVTNAAPGDSLAVRAYSETGDSLETLSLVAEQPTTIEVRAGRFDVLPLRSGHYRVYVTRAAPRRVVKGETLDGRFSFELAGSTPVAPSSGSP